jgi:Protein of unknown function (DUF3237)
MAQTQTRLDADELFTLSIDFADFQAYPTALGTRLVAVVAGGRVAGPRLDGEVMPGGGDCLLLGPDGVARMDVRATVRTSGGDMLYLTGQGRTRLLDGARDHFVGGETVTERDGQLHSRLALLFEVAAGEHGWLNSAVAVGLVSELSQHHIEYRCYGIA